MGWPHAATLGAFVAAAAVIAVVGTRLSGLADRLADRTGMGEALMGALFLGAATSLPGLVATLEGAWQGHARFAMSNAIGGIAVQTAFIGVADLAYRKANLEHAAASVPNILNATLILTLLAGLLLAAEMPEIVVWGVHPMTPVLAGMYVFGVRLIKRNQDQPQWFPRRTLETREDVAAEPGSDHASTASLWIQFGTCAAIIGGAGWVTARAGLSMAATTGISESVVGALLTGVATSLPELITSIAAVRRGALTLAVGGIFGGNAFDVMFATAGDVAYRKGSIYHAVGTDERYLLALTAVMTGVLLAGLVHREKHGAAGIGFEGAAALVLYVGGMLILAAM